MCIDNLMRHNVNFTSHLGLLPVQCLTPNALLPKRDRVLAKKYKNGENELAKLSQMKTHNLPRVLRGLYCFLELDVLCKQLCHCARFGLKHTK